MSATAALVPGWTEQNPPTQSLSLANSASVSSVNDVAVGGNTTFTNLSSCWPYYDYHWWYAPYYIYPSVPNRVHLTSKEVDRLRAAAKRDAKLKAVLEKFTPVIEVEVEF